MKRKPIKDRLFLNWKDEAIHTHFWFKSYGINRQAVHQSVKNKLIRKLGGGAYIKAKDKLNWQSAVWTAQKELKLPFHVAGQTALELQGLGHFVKIGKPFAYMVKTDHMRVPVWLKNNHWGVVFHFRNSSLFPPDLALMKYNKSKFHFILSSRERAIMEMISHLELGNSFETLERYFEGLLNLRGFLVQKLLENCSSIKVKRVFLYMADKLKLPIMKNLNTRRIQLGHGKRVISHKGKLNKVYNITVPIYDNDSN